MQPEYILTNLQDLLLFPLKDRESRNRLYIAIALTFAGFIVPLIPSLFVMGYAAVIMQKIIVDREKPTMPEWTDWNRLLILGFRLFSVISVYVLPAFIVMVIGYFAMMMPVFNLSWLDSANQSASPWGFLSSIFFGMALGMVLFGIGMLLLALTWLVMPPSLGHTIASDSFSAGFHFRDWWKILMANQGGFFISLVLSGGLYMLLMMAVQAVYWTVFLCFLFPIVVSALGGYLNIVVLAIFAQAYREAVMKLEEGTPVEVVAGES